MPRNLPISRALSMTFSAVLTALSALSISATAAQASEGFQPPVQLSLWSPLQIFGSDQSVRGIRYSLFWGVNRDLMGLDISTLANKATGNVLGSQVALFLNRVDGTFTGLQATGSVNQVDGKFVGTQIGMLVNISRGDFTGLQLSGFGSDTRGHLRGAQLGATSFAGDVTGFQLSMVANRAANLTGAQFGGGVNTVKTLTGIQLGFINHADDVTGLQLGLINVNKNGLVPVLPFFNFGI